LSWNGIRKESFEKVLQKEQIAPTTARQHRPHVEGTKIVVVRSLGRNQHSDQAPPDLKKQTFVSKQLTSRCRPLTGRFITEKGFTFTEFCYIVCWERFGAAHFQLRALLSVALVVSAITLTLDLSSSFVLRFRYWLPLVLPLGGPCFMTSVC